MHLWPTVRLRESFKPEYLWKMERNMERMNSEKRKSLKKSRSSGSTNTPRSSSSSGTGYLVGCYQDVALFFVIFCSCFGACCTDEDSD